jgi:uncharacterized membrane protein
MTWTKLMSDFGLLDAAALLFVWLAWLASGLLIEHPPRRRQSVTVLMADHRREWMRQLVTRQQRIFDGAIIDSLRQGSAFFASACMIAIGAGAALISNPAPLESAASDLAALPVAEGVQLRVLLVVLFLADGLLKFIWSNRLFAYCAVLMGAVPNDPADPLAYHRAAMAADMNINAARSFDRGLRSVYFAVAAVAWLAGPVPLIVATAFSVLVMMRREFASQSRIVLMDRRE